MSGTGTVKEATTGPVTELGDRRVATELPASALVTSPPGGPKEASRLEVALRLGRSEVPVTETAVARSSGPAAPRELVAAVGSVKGALGWLSAVLEGVGDLAEASCQKNEHLGAEFADLRKQLDAQRQENDHLVRLTLPRKSLFFGRSCRGRRGHTVNSRRRWTWPAMS